jgi:hypothetical protein
MRLLQRPRRVERLVQLIVLAAERSNLAAPHLKHDAQCLFESLEALSNGWVRDAEAAARARTRPRPMPSAARPPDSTSSVETVLARMPGWR